MRSSITIGENLSTRGKGGKMAGPDYVRPSPIDLVHNSDLREDNGPPVTALMQAKILRSLNEAVEQDAAAIQTLIGQRVPCNEALADHATIQCGLQHPAAGELGWTVGPLGLINGVLGAAGIPLIAAQFDDETGNFVGFCDYESCKK